MGAPLATVAAFNAVLFTVRGQMEAVLRSEPGVLNPKGFCTPCPGKSGERSCHGAISFAISIDGCYIVNF